MKTQSQALWRRLCQKGLPYSRVMRSRRRQRLGRLLGIAHRTVQVNFDHFKQRFSARKLIPVNGKSLGDYLLLKRIEADLSYPEMAVKSGVSGRKVMAWEHDHITPTEAEWQVLAGILRLDSTFLTPGTQR